MRTKYRNGDHLTLIHTNCDGCTPSVVLGQLCHEAGCPDAWRDKKLACRECGCDFYPQDRHQRVCEDCAMPAPDYDTRDQEGR